MSNTTTPGESSDSTIGLYTKAIATLVVTGLTAYIAAVSDENVTTMEWITIIIAVLVATGVVWAVPSTPQWLQSYGKAVAGALVAGLSSIAVGLVDGDPDGVVGSLSQAEIVTAVVAFITALGIVAVAPNAASSDPVNPTTHKLIPVSRDEKLNMVVRDTGAPTATQLPPEDTATA